MAIPTTPIGRSGPRLGFRKMRPGTVQASATHWGGGRFSGPEVAPETLQVFGVGKTVCPEKSGASPGRKRNVRRYPPTQKVSRHRDSTYSGGSLRRPVVMPAATYVMEWSPVLLPRRRTNLPPRRFGQKSPQHFRLCGEILGESLKIGGDPANEPPSFACSRPQRPL